MPTNERGRFNKPVPKANLVEIDDFLEFEHFADEDGSEAVPRTGPGASAVSVQNMDMCLQVNKSNHNTTAYNNRNLVVRRGLEFIVQVTFSRPLTAADDFQLEFLIGNDPSPTLDTYVVVTFGSRPGGPWSGRVVENKGQTLTLGITPPPDTIVGKYRSYVAVILPNGVQHTKRDAKTDLYLLFNAWNKDDAVFYADEPGRKEYVLSDHGVIYQGSFDNMTQRSWDYGQFEAGILDACIYILDASKMPVFDRGNVIKLTRMASAMLNSLDDDGVLVGNWSDDYSMGTSPTSWTGSVGILQQYIRTGLPVCFAQCWVYAAVFTSFLRCLGIPSRVITNFVSAHDNNGNIVINLVFNSDGSQNTTETKDTIWNYHCWTEAFMTRPDLPAGLEGWQVVDATPQETSGGFFRCGPASVAAIKEGLLCHPFDLKFCFAEVNSVVVSSTIDRYKKVTPFDVNHNYVGKAVLTKAIGSTSSENITISYKYPKGSRQDRVTMARAQEYITGKTHPDLPKSLLSVKINADQVQVGEDVKLEVVFTNQSEDSVTVSAHLSGLVTFYTGAPAATAFKNEDFTVTVDTNQTQRVPFHIKAQDYLTDQASLLNLSFSVSAQNEGESVSAIKLVSLKAPKLGMTVSKAARLQKQMFASLSFTNPMTFPLTDVTVTMESSGLITPRKQSYSTIPPLGSITWTESFIPQVVGLKYITASLDCKNLRGVTGFIAVSITP
ncbi:coagulation factor XIII A chain-like [Betta splendens]|uniref:Coagulation factor XIII A chain-like n=1 Tax=Betta splendens TaxID=158456 RepID=A0A6P7MFU0_BETSP|nr:coagulation factor XIII A chain-like [Betta splendens]